MEAKEDRQMDEDRGRGRKIDEEDDVVAFVGSPRFTRNAEMKSSGQGLYLDTNLVRGSISREVQDVHADNGFQRQVAVVTVVFDLPDGSQADQEFQMGQTVEVLKSFVESEFGIPMSCQELYLGSVLMMDPMTLLDYPEVDGAGDVLIVVEGEMNEDTKK
ncbi:unnamed protein product [Ectocarpus sp. 13 AM-2016]